MLVPLRPSDLNCALGALTIQRVARARAARQRLAPRLAPRLLRLRGAMHIQRWWRTWLVLERVNMLRFVRARTAAVTSNKLYLRRALFEGLGGRPPLHASELWPEHRLRLAFAPPPEASVQLAPPERTAVELAAGDPEPRGGLPSWASPPIQEAPPEADTPLELQAPLALFTVRSPRCDRYPTESNQIQPDRTEAPTQAPEPASASDLTQT